MPTRPKVWPAIFYFSRRANPPTPPLYHTTICEASQVSEILNFCYKCVTTPVTCRSLIPQDSQVCQICIQYTFPYKLHPTSWEAAYKLGRDELRTSWDRPRLRGCPIFEHNFFAHESMFGSWVPRIAYTKNWLARSRAILDKIGSPKKLEKPNFRRRDFWEQNFGKLEKKIFFL